jgi:RNAse (barnase) inhibitor barstar
MGASNFCYVNRCVVTSNDDYEFNNLPKLGDWCNNNRNYPSKEVLINELSCCKDYIKSIKPIRLHRIVMTSGYYEHACIDFVCNDSVYNSEYVFVTDCLGSLGYYNFQDMKVIQSEIVETFQITNEEFETIYNKVMSNMGITENDEDDFDVFFDVLMNEINDKIIDNERIHCNKIIDLIKEGYGYEEYGCVCVASNGETLYNKID